MSGSGRVITLQLRIEDFSMRAMQALADAHAKKKKIPDHVKPHVEIIDNGQVAQYQWVWVED